jgi:hypothetical protein
LPPLPSAAALSAWIRKTFAPEYAKLGPPAEQRLGQHPRTARPLFAILGYYGKDPAVLAQANQIAAQYLADPASVDATLGQTALPSPPATATPRSSTACRRSMKPRPIPSFRRARCACWPSLRIPALIQRSLDYAVSGKVRNQDAAIQFAIALQNDATREQAWKYIQNHWEKVQAQFTTEMGAVLVSSTGSFCSAEARDSVKQFFSTHKVASSDKPSSTPSSTSTAASSCAGSRSRI